MLGDCLDRLRELPDNSVEGLGAMNCSPKIIQILIAPNDSTWQGILLGLGDDGITYQVGTGAKWEPMIPPINSLENSLVSPQNEQ